MVGVITSYNNLYIMPLFTAIYHASFNVSILTSQKDHIRMCVLITGQKYLKINRNPFLVIQQKYYK